MPEYTGDLHGAEFAQADLTGARLTKVRLNGARLRMVDLSGAQLRDISLAGAEIDGVIDGLEINGVEVAPLIEAELNRRDPHRALRLSTDPADLQSAWATVEQHWAATYERVAGMPAGTVDISVDDEWSFSQTLRHLVFATDAWLGGVRRERGPFHPWGLPFTDVTDFVERPEDLGVDSNANPTYEQVLELRADRTGQVRAFLAGVTPDELAREAHAPVWDDYAPVSVHRCLRVIINEEIEHHRFAVRDLDVIAAS